MMTSGDLVGAGRPARSENNGPEEDDDLHRRLFPLSSAGWCKTRWERDRLQEAVGALNWMQGIHRRPVGEAGGARTQMKIGALHQEVREEILSHVRAWGAPPEEITPQTAFSELLRGRSPYGGETHATLAPFSHARLSVPSSVVDSPLLATLLPEAAKKQLEGFEKHMLRPLSEVAELDKELGKVVGYVDPALRASRRLYTGLVKRLLSIGMVRLSPTARCTIGVFCVKKKGGAIRLILDCRPSNRFFRAPPGVQLVTGEGLAQIEVHPDFSEELSPLAVWLGVADVKDCFQHMLLNDRSVLGEYLAYPAVTAG